MSFTPYQLIAAELRKTTNGLSHQYARHTCATQQEVERLEQRVLQVRTELRCPQEAEQQPALAIRRAGCECCRWIADGVSTILSLWIFSKAPPPRMRPRFRRREVPKSCSRSRLRLN